MENIYGWTPSELDGSEHQFTSFSNFPIPEEYSFIDFLPPIWNQGNTQMCVTYALSAHLDWNYNCDHNQENHTDNKIDRNKLYANRGHNGDGMAFKVALGYVHKNSIGSNKGNIRIEQYAMVHDVLSLKQALVLNGPCIAGLMVYNDSSPFFWEGKGKYSCKGGHAIAIVGYNKDGFIIRNSWGTSWGYQGYTILPYNDFNKIIECWTIID